MYVAVPANANVSRPDEGERLYVGAQKGDRMFRGDRPDTYHHWQMRQGNGSDTPEAYMNSGQRIAIWRIAGKSLNGAVTNVPELRILKPLLDRARPRGIEHIGWCFEQAVLAIDGLAIDGGKWRWNTTRANRRVCELLSHLGVTLKTE